MCNVIQLTIKTHFFLKNGTFVSEKVDTNEKENILKIMKKIDD